MKALILAAGRGERMRPLTLATPKPLLEVGNKSLIGRHLERLAAFGTREVVINTAWLGEKIHSTLGDGTRFGLQLRYSHEGDEPLETGGALLHAREVIGEEPFLLVNGDIWTDYDFETLPKAPAGVAHLVMVPVPRYAARGDFCLDAAGRLHESGSALSTYAGIGVFRMALLNDWQKAIGEAAAGVTTPPRFPLLPLLREAMSRNAITGEMHHGQWTDVGTPARLAELDQRLREGKPA